MRVRPVVRWAGGKSRLLKRLLPRVPEHVCYVELFSGGAALLLAKARSQIEVLNDVNGDLVSLYRCAQYHLPALLAEMEFTLNSRKNLVDFIAQPGLTEIQRAARWYVRNHISFAAGMTSYAVTRRGGGASSRINWGEGLKSFNERMDRVSVENLSYERCLELYDAKETFVFADPPYLNSKGGNYRGWNGEEMTLFRDRITAMKGRWLVTVDDSPFNRKLFRGCRIEGVQTRNGAVNHATNPNAKFGELIISKK